MTFSLRDIDKRLIRRQIERGRIDEKAYRQFVEALPDVAHKLAPRDDAGARESED